MSVLGRRLKQARQSAGLSQEQLGIQAELDPMSASTRMNRYELGVRVPGFELVERFAAVLNVPATYFYAAKDDEAELLLDFHSLSADERVECLQFVKNLQAKPDSVRSVLGR